MELCTALKTTDNLKLAADCDTDMPSKPACTFVLVLPDRSPRLLKVVHLSSERHTGELLAGAQLDARHYSIDCAISLHFAARYMHVVQQHAPHAALIKVFLAKHGIKDKVALLVTDSGADIN
jgi:hypothetical protein